MAHPKTGRTRISAAEPAANGAGNRTVQNKILLGLPIRERNAILSKLEFFPLPVPMVLNEVAERIKYAYFVNDGLASVLKVMEDGSSVEVGLCGREGFVGVPLIVGFSSSPTRVIMQVGGSGFRISAKNLAAAMDDCPTLVASLRRFAQELALQSEQIAACNRLHEVEERLARWLLMCQDRLGGNAVPLTHTFLAHMLGTRRASVTEAAGILQKINLIRCSRGLVVIEHRGRLENAACECYGVLTRQIAAWHRETNEHERKR